MKTAQAFDNRVNRQAAVLDTARPFVAIKPKGFLLRVIGHYSTMKAAKAAAKRWNEENKGLVYGTRIAPESLTKRNERK